MPKEKAAKPKEPQAGQTEETDQKEKDEDKPGFDTLPPHFSDKLDSIYKEALGEKETLQVVLSIQKAKDFIQRTKLNLTKKKEKNEFYKSLDAVKKKLKTNSALVPQLDEIKKRNAEFVVIRRLMDLIAHKIKSATATNAQIDQLLKITLLFCICNNPHIKSVQAAFHLLQIFLEMRIKEYSNWQEMHKKLIMRSNSSDAAFRKQLKTWLEDEERLIKVYKELSTPIRLGGSGGILDEEFTDDERQLLLEHRHVAEGQCSKSVKTARKKFYFIFGNMATVPPLIEHTREYTTSILGGKEQLQSLQDLSLLCCMVRTYVQELSRLQQHIHISPQIAQKKILTLLNNANPYIFAGYKKVAEIPKAFFELILLENIGYFLTYYVLLIGGIFKNPQIKSPQMQALIEGTIRKLSSDQGNQKVRDMLQKQFATTMENFGRKG